MTIVMPEQANARRQRRRRWTVPLLLLVAFAAVVLFVFRRDDAHDTLVRQSVLKVEVTTQGGNVRINTTPNAGVVLSYRDRYAFFRPEITQVFEGTTLKVKIHCGWRPACSSDITITASSDMEIVATATDGSITAEGRSGAMALLTHDGTINVTGTAGPLSAKSGAGAVTISGGKGPVAVTTNSGPVQASALESPTVDIATGTGTIDAGFAKKPQSVSATSLNGTIVLGVPDSSYRLALSSPSTATVRNDTTASASIKATSQGQVTVSAR
ncbi:MAG: DUF4097 family beta strand repeat-containing protein [Acidimicrobiia bacterium]